MVRSSGFAGSLLFGNCVSARDGVQFRQLPEAVGPEQGRAGKRRRRCQSGIGRRVRAGDRRLATNPASARSPQQLKNFVGELLGYEQKAFVGAALLTGGTSDEEHVLTLFRRHVLDDRQLAADMNATVNAYDALLFDQERKLVEAPGISPAQWARTVNVAKPAPSNWNAAIRPVVMRATGEARQDVVRFVATWIASDWTRDGVRKVARDAGLDRTEEGSWADVITDFAVDAAAGAAWDYATDPTDRIVSRLSNEMARAEYVLLDGDQGLFAALRGIKAAHEQARAALLSTTSQR